MKQKTSLYAVLILTIGLLLLEHALRLTPTGHKAVLIFSVALIYSLVSLWIKSNTALLEGEPNRAVWQQSQMAQYEAGDD